jgi:hypothetical protein
MLIRIGRTAFAQKEVFVLKQIIILGLLLAPLYGRAQAPPLSQSPAAAATAGSVTITAIRAGRLLDVESGRTLLNQIILVTGGRIQAVGTGIAIPDGANVIDLSGMTVLPGLIDCHTHLADLADAEPLMVLQRSAAETAYAAIPNARVTLMGGFTTVRDVGVYRAFNDVAMRDAIARDSSSVRVCMLPERISPSAKGQVP